MFINVYGKSADKKQLFYFQIVSCNLQLLKEYVLLYKYL